MAKDSDPTKDPEFQKVVQTFLRTPPKPHAPKAGERKAARKGKRKRAASRG
jgi:hypothetical protein